MKASTYIRLFKKENKKDILYIFSSEDPEIKSSTAAIVCSYPRTVTEMLKHAPMRYYVTTYYEITDTHSVVSFDVLGEAIDHALHNIR